MTDVRWSLFVEDAPVPSVRDVTSIMVDPFAALASHAETTIAMIADDWFDERQWREFFGEDWRGTVDLEVASPVHLAGRWRVDLELKINSNARRI